MRRIKEILEFVLGANPRLRFKRLVILLAGCGIFLFLFLNFRCGGRVLAPNTWWIEWDQGAEIHIERGV